MQLFNYVDCFHTASNRTVTQLDVDCLDVHCVDGHLDCVDRLDITAYCVLTFCTASS